MSFIIYPFDFSTITMTINTGGEDSGYPIENLEDGNWNTQWKNDNDTETVILDIQFSSAIDPTYMIIANHNLTNTGRGIKLAADENNDGNYSSLEYLVGSSGAYHDYTSSDATFWIETFTMSGDSTAYYRLTIEDLAGTKPYLALLMIGEYYSLETNHINPYRSNPVYGNEMRTTEGGQTKVNQLHDAKQHFELSWEDFDSTDKSNFDSILEVCQGSLYPFVIEDIDGNNYYVRMQENSFNIDTVEYQLYNNSITLIEEN